MVRTISVSRWAQHDDKRDAEHPGVEMPAPQRAVSDRSHGSRLLARGPLELDDAGGGIRARQREEVTRALRAEHRQSPQTVARRRTFGVCEHVTAAAELT